MKRIIIFVLTAAILLSMVGCTKKKADNTVDVFCLNMDVTSSVPESYVLRSKNSDVDKQVDELLGRLQDKPDNSKLRKAIPDEVSVRGHEEKNYNCTVDFSKEYYDLTAAQEVLLRASVVRTLTQLDSISYVTFTVNSIPLVDSDDEIVGSMGADDFVENPGEQINTSVKETHTLYFADKDGTGLEKQTRVIHYSSNIALEKLVLEQLIEGPKGSKLKATLPVKKLSDEISDIKDGFGKEQLDVDDYAETAIISRNFNELMSGMKVMDESRQEFVSNVSHELKTPLTSMKVLADSINSMGDEAPIEMYREFMGDITSEIDRETKIINDLLSDRKSVV